ncbi:MAG TPA: methyltransferase [Devosia sp.]
MDMAAFDQVRQLAASHYLVRALHVAAELDVAGRVGQGKRPVAALAEEADANADALGRLLRLLASRGIFVFDGTDVSNTPASELLASGHPASLRDFVLMFGQPIQWTMAGDLMHAVRSGEAVADRAHDGGLWSYFKDNPEYGRQFDGAMTAKSAAQIGGILATHDFSRYRRIVDVGGGRGHLLAAIRGRHPQLECVLFDLPQVIAAAEAEGAAAQLRLVGGDFFTNDLPAGDAIILQEILHDWDDAHCHRILAAARRALAPGQRLLVIETEVPPGDTPDWSKLLDVVMLAAFAARQRTADEYRTLLAAQGFRLLAGTDTGAGISIFEAEPL